MEQDGGEFSESEAPPPIEQSSGEDGLPLGSAEEPGLPQREDGPWEAEEAVAEASEPDDSLVLGPFEPTAFAGDEEEAPAFEPAATGDEEEPPISESGGSGDEEEAPEFESADPSHGDEAEGEVAVEDTEPLVDAEVVGEEGVEEMAAEEENPVDVDAAEEEAIEMAAGEENLVDVDAAEEEAIEMAAEEMEPVDAEATGEEEMEMAVEEMEASVDAASKSTGKRKRGRPRKSQAVKQPVKKKEEEDVCFVCFDGGNLVVCDRRGCPKVYHPSCVNRDETFFRSRGRWTCGWHICSICEKAAHYMCYTCTYSLCKGCIKEAGFVCLRGNKGFCEACYQTVVLIESNQHANGEKLGIDFDDKNSFEYLFKEYWFDVKRKLSITLEELKSAKNPWKASGASTRNEESSDELYDANDDQEASSDSSSGRLAGGSSSRKKVRRRPRITANEESSFKQTDNEGSSMPGDTEWASKELLEFVAHMKGGDTSVLSQFDVQALLLEYIKQNNLRDPRRKSQIICDTRLQNLFGKPRVGHFEMLKLLELHFLLKEVSQVGTDDNQGGVVDPDSNQMDAEGYSDATTKMSFDKRRKTRKKVEEREPQTNLDDYAAIDVHNINLIYLRRNLMEDLLDDIDKFNEKVVGSFVRIRISGTGQRQDLYRLVQVVGTHKMAETYKTGRRTTDIKLEILNLNKTEFISIDTISNQEFTEEECKRLRQSIKCGLISRLTVGDIQEKARMLQAVRVNDWLESEKLRLGHLRDRASEKGRRKELRECVEKLQLLSSPEERRRRLNELPEIHADPNMDPEYESDDEGETDDKKQDNYKRSKESSFLRKGRDLISPGRGGSASDWGGARKSSNATWESSRNRPTENPRDKVEQFSGIGDRTNELSWNQSNQTSSWETTQTQTIANGLEAGIWNSHQPALSPRQPYGVAPEATPTSLSSGGSLPSNTSETEKIWHYRDPSGKIQGPFSMTQLRKWSTTGYFPPDLRIWRASEKQEDSILLTDVLNGKFQKDLPQWEPQHDNFPQATVFADAADSRENKMEGGWRGDNNQIWVDSKQNRGNWGRTGNTEQASADRWASQSSTWSTPRTEVVTPREGRIGISPRVWESSKDTNSWSGQTQAHSSTSPTAPLSGNPYGQPPYQGRGSQGGNAGRWDRAQDRGDTWNSNRPLVSQPSNQGYNKQHSNWSSSSQQAFGDLSNVQPAHNSRNQWGNDPFHLPTPTPQPISRGWTTAQGPVNAFGSPTVPVQAAGSGWGTTKMAYKTAETDAAQILERGNSLGDSNISPQQKNPSESERSGGLSKKQFFESDCPSPTPGSERHELPTVQQCELDPGKQWPESNKGGGSDSASVIPALETSDPPAYGMPEVENLQSVSSASVEDKCLADDMQKLANSKCLPSEQQGNMSPIAGMEDKTTHRSPSTMPTSDSRRPESIPALRSEAALELISAFESSAQKQDPDNPSVSPTPSGHGLDHNQIQKSEPSLSAPESVKNLGGPADAIGGECSMPSPTPPTKPSVWNDSTDSTSVNSRNNLFVLSNGSGLLASTQRQASTAVGLTQPGAGVGPAQANATVDWGTATQGNINIGWTTTAQGNTNVAWATPAQGNTNVNMGWGTTAAQGSTIPNIGWGALQPGNSNANTGWVTPAQGITNASAGWGMPLPGTSNLNAGWGAPAPGNTTNPGWGQPTQGVSNLNSGWGAALTQEGNTNVNAGWGTGLGNTNAGWGSSAGNPNSWGSQQQQDGERYKGNRGSDSGHGGGKNDRIQYGGGGGGSSRPPRGQGQRVGICKFHENGHCRKGASCNYLHS